MRHSDFAVAERRLRRKLLRFPSQQHDRVQPLRDHRVPARVARWRLLGEGAEQVGLLEEVHDEGSRTLGVIPSSGAQRASIHQMRL